MGQVSNERCRYLLNLGSRCFLITVQVVYLLASLWKVAMHSLHAENQRHTPDCSKEKGFTFERLSVVSANSRCGLAELTCFMGLLNRCSYYILLHLQILYSISSSSS
ncbi:hypothetical protein FGO68_gene7314 [Halteria grandinella]|uniref:Uncharacterized protein n=1 Tax=Halteria grandinella TaxID=5974 RepID=A0A8J8T4E4_HALGN|nr:hypothetical protein FGO68_gene7314 [Halteria grandinella]